MGLILKRVGLESLKEKGCLNLLDLINEKI